MFLGKSFTLQALNGPLFRAALSIDMSDGHLGFSLSQPVNHTIANMVRQHSPIGFMAKGDEHLHGLNRFLDTWHIELPIPAFGEYPRSDCWRRAAARYRRQKAVLERTVDWEPELGCPIGDTMSNKIGPPLRITGIEISSKDDRLVEVAIGGKEVVDSFDLPLESI